MTSTAATPTQKGQWCHSPVIQAQCCSRSHRAAVVDRCRPNYIFIYSEDNIYGYVISNNLGQCLKYTSRHCYCSDYCNTVQLVTHICLLEAVHCKDVVWDKWLSAMTPHDQTWWHGSINRIWRSVVVVQRLLLSFYLNVTFYSVFY